MMRKSIIVALLGVAQYCSAQIKQCYYNNPPSEANDIPCDPDSEVSACCGRGWSCGTNLYCEQQQQGKAVQQGQKVVGSCTDESWNDPACPLKLSWSPFSVCLTPYLDKHCRY